MGTGEILPEAEPQKNYFHLKQATILFPWMTMTRAIIIFTSIGLTHTYSSLTGAPTTSERERWLRILASYSIILKTTGSLGK